MHPTCSAMPGLPAHAQCSTPMRTGVAEGDKAKAAGLAGVLLAHDGRLLHRPKPAEVLLQREVVGLPGDAAAAVATAREEGVT